MTKFMTLRNWWKFNSHGCFESNFEHVRIEIIFTLNFKLDRIIRFSPIYLNDYFKLKVGT